MTNKTSFDVIVIGAGHNGLSAAATLAKKGKSVCVIEKSYTLGGMARTEEIASGVAASRIAHLIYNLNQKVVTELGIAEAVQLTELPTVSLSPDGNHVIIQGDEVTFTNGTVHPEAAVYTALRQRMLKFAALLGQLSTKSPPKLDGGLTDLATLGELAGLAKLGLDLKRMGKKDMREFLRVILSNVYDLLLDELEDAPLAGAAAADAVRGNYMGPRSPGSVFSWMYRFGNGGEVALPTGGLGEISNAFADVARKAGCEIRTGQGVARVLVEKDQTTGVELEDGTVLNAPAVLSSAGPMQTMQMTGVGHFDVEAARRIRNLRCKGTVAKVNLVLKGVPTFKGLDAKQIAGRMLIAPSATYVERAFNPVKYNELPTAPTIEAIIPTLTDKTLCNDGRHVLSAAVSFVPYTPEGGWTDDARRQLADTTIAALAAYAPDIADLVEHVDVVTPADIEVMTGAPGGHWHHAEMGIDQILTVRPVNGLAHYRFAVSGLYLCGASAHPGGDVSGVPGRNSALQLLKDGVV